VVGARLLPKARARNNTDTSGLKQVRGVEDICWLSSFLGSYHGLLGQGDAGEGIHGPLHSVAGDALQDGNDKTQRIIINVDKS
jgi:hypothetical protein